MMMILPHYLGNEKLGLKLLQLLLLLFIKFAFKRTLLKQINSIKTVLEQC